jgi:glycosyltransferase involved in cell wall biosynthesis
MSQQTRLGGFVLHRNNRDTLERCIRSLQTVCDEVVAVDSGATDGSVELARELGARSITHRWAGYGNARALGVQALGVCNYVFFLDSDEWLEEEAIACIRGWKASQPTAPVYRLPVHDRVEAEGHRFLYRRHWRSRLVRREHATWQPRMIVHEAIARLPFVRLEAPIEHRFATQLARRSAKEDRYALLWALRAWGEGRRAKPVGLQRVAHFVKDALLQGALWRGGVEGARMAWAVSRFHSAKYSYLRALRRGAYPELRAAFSEQRYADVFETLWQQQLPAGGEAAGRSPTAGES